jgi:hypothetical protein
MWFQHDDAITHCTRVVWNLTHRFLIAGLVWEIITWLLHSPYLAPIDFFLRGHLRLTGTLFREYCSQFMQRAPSFVSTVPVVLAAKAH